MAVKSKYVGHGGICSLGYGMGLDADCLYRKVSCYVGQNAYMVVASLTL
jgi:hypothetical protein